MVSKREEKVSCKYEPGMVCFHIGNCTFPSLITCLQHNLYLAHKELSFMKEKRNLKHTKVSLKWRNNSFYYKKKLKALEDWIIAKGMKVPKIEELFPQSTQEANPVNLESEIITTAPIQEEKKDEQRICDSNKEGV